MAEGSKRDDKAIMPGSPPVTPNLRIMRIIALTVDARVRHIHMPQLPSALPCPKHAISGKRSRAIRALAPRRTGRALSAGWLSSVRGREAPLTGAGLVQHRLHPDRQDSCHQVWDRRDLSGGLQLVRRAIDDGIDESQKTIPVLLLKHRGIGRERSLTAEITQLGGWHQRHQTGEDRAGHRPVRQKPFHQLVAVDPADTPRAAVAAHDGCTVHRFRKNSGGSKRTGHENHRPPEMKPDRDWPAAYWRLISL